MNELILQKTQLQKLQILLNNIDIIENENGTIIKFNKNVMLDINGSLVTNCRGFKVDLAEQIHLNPIIDIDKTNFNNLKDTLIEQNQIQQKIKQDEISQYIEHTNCMCEN